jgi:hypothetical protein
MVEDGDGLFIVYPVKYLETILLNRREDRTAGILRTGNVKSSPIFVQQPTSGELQEDNTANSKSYLQIPSFGQFTRISASGDKNNCWFDAFLCCMSPKYRMLSLNNRQIVVQGFRNLCRENVGNIAKEMPSILTKKYTPENLAEELTATPPREISMLAGFAIAWYFGVNIIYINIGNAGAVLDTTLPVQSQDCKTIFIGRVGEDHYEPVGILVIENTKLDETRSAFVFEWIDKTICEIPNRPADWTLPTCAPVPAPVPRAPITAPPAPSTKPVAPLPVAPSTKPVAPLPPAEKPVLIKGTVGTATYYEGQDSQLSCGRHALNNLLHRQRFVKDGGLLLKRLDVDPKLTDDTQLNLPQICDLYQRELRKTRKKDARELCQAAENYAIDILIAALNIAGYEAISMNIIERPKQDEPDTYGFLINLGGGHWVSATREKDGYMYYNSIASTERNKRAINYRDFFRDFSRQQLERKNGKLVPKFKVDKKTGKLIPVYELDTKIGDIVSIYRIKNRGAFINPIANLTERIAESINENTVSIAFGKKKDELRALINNLKLKQSSKEFLIQYLINNASSQTLLNQAQYILNEVQDTNVENIKSRNAEEIFTELQTAILLRNSNNNSNANTNRTVRRASIGGKRRGHKTRRRRLQKKRRSTRTV